MKSSRNIVSIVIGIIIVGLIFVLFNLINSFDKNSLYINKTVKYGRTVINYPYFNNDLDLFVNGYINERSLRNYQKIDYEVGKKNNYTSILFKKYQNDKLIEYDAHLFGSNYLETDINSIIKDVDKLKEKVGIYLDNTNIDTSNIEIVDYIYQLLDKSLLVILKVNRDNQVDFIKVEIDYNELDDLLNISFDINPDYVKLLTTVTTTTTTKPINKDSNGRNKVIAFTFDDGPSKYTSLIMDELDKFGAKATFFEVGYMMKSRRDTVNEVLNRGFEIGNHTTDHSNLNSLSNDKVKEKVYDNNTLFYEITNRNFPLLRPPYGNCKNSIRDLIDVPIIKWSVDSRDWESRDKDKIVPLVKKYTSSGDIVLFHDLYESTYESIKILVPYFYEEGYQIVSVSELFAINGLQLEPSKVYYNAKV